MTTPVLHFTPRNELGPKENLQDFIELCKQSDVLLARMQFELNIWEAGHLKGQNKVNRVVFSTHEAAERNEPEPSLPQPFLDFAKATIVYLQSQKPVVSNNVRIAALRCLDAALREWNKGSRPTAVNVEILDSAVELARKRFSPDVAYRVAGQLALISDLMKSKGFVVLREPWVHGMKKPSDLGSRISKEALDARQNKLPSAAVLRALAGIFQEATAPGDILVSSFTALMLCAPERINEVLRLRRNCLVEGEGRFVGKLGLRWSGSKLADDTTKWLPTQMVPVARETVSNILKVTSNAQEVAAWYTAHPDKLFLHPKAEHLRSKEVLSLAEIALVLWGDTSATDSTASWAKQTAKIEKISIGHHKIGYRFMDLEKAVLKMLPATFPYMLGDPTLLCKDAMSLMLTNGMHSVKATYACMFTCIDYGAITQSLGRAGHESIFKRFAYTEDDGTPILVKSHSLRHYLNMLAQVGGLSSAEIAIFSGRKDVRQNRAYDHMTSDEVQAPISQALKAGFTGTLVPASSRDLVVRSEFRNKGIGAAHTTEFGWCMHNFASEPCQMHRDCINCEEQECIKGEAHKEANLRRLKEETEYLLQQAREALTEEELGADNWVKHQTQTLDRVKALLAIMEDESVPQGARVRLNLANASLITNDSVRPIKVISARGRKALK
jgi:hypothetical protein